MDRARPDRLTALAAEHVASGNAVTILTAVIDDPSGYGRVVRESDGTVAAWGNDSVGQTNAFFFDAQGKLVYAYRDCHDGQFPQQDWGASDVEIWQGAPTALAGVCAQPGSWRMRSTISLR